MDALMRGRGLVLLLCVVCLGVATTPSAAGARAERCRDAILKAAGKYVKARTRVLASCNEGVVRGKSGFNGLQGRDCRDTSGKTQFLLDKARTKIQRDIEKRCGGADRTCHTGDDLDIDDPVIGWGASGPFGNGFTGICPDFASSGCRNIINHCGGANSDGEGITDCVLCLNDSVIDQTADLLYADLDASKFGAGSEPDRAINKCQRAFVKATAKHALARSKALGKCWTALNKGKSGFSSSGIGGCTDSAGKTEAKIDKSESKMIQAICKACGGSDRRCDQTLLTIGGAIANLPGTPATDLDSVADIGFGTSCPDVTLPYPPSTNCGEQDNLGSGSVDDVIENMAEFVGCVDCVLAFRVDCADRAVVPNHESMPLECNACVADTDGGLCPTSVRVLADAFRASLDSGYTGLAHDAQVTTNGALSFAVSNCDGTNRPSCGECDLSGPIENAGSELFDNHRCRGDSALRCSVDSDCGVSGPCVFYFGNPLALSAGGTSACVTNEVVGAVTGTIDVESGSSETMITLTSRVHIGVGQADPCPRCEFDENAQEHRCTRGVHEDDACTPSSLHPVFGTLSWDCPPSGLVGTLPITLAPSTGVQSVTLSAASPGCRAAGFSSLKCNCDTCAGPDLTPCRTDADCAAAVTCGGDRCLPPSSNRGDPCSAPSDCIGGGCGSVGEPTKPNACIDAVCSPNPADTDTIDEGVCNAGPFDNQCSVERFRSCIVDDDCRPLSEGGTCADCLPGPQTCTFFARECFPDSGRIGTRCYGGTNDPDVDTCGSITDCPDQSAGTFCGGGSVSVSGVADPGCGSVSTPQLGTLFCIPPTQSPAINAASGLPGQGRLRLPVTAEFDL